MTPVTVQYYKHPRTLHWRHDMLRLGEDDHGVWLGAPLGSTVQKGDDPPMNMRRSFVQLIPERAWWTALFNDPLHTRIAVYIDIVADISWPTPDRVEMVDLDLDVIALTDGAVYIEDEDEFEEHQVSLGYPPRTVAMARATAARLALELEQRVSPFDGVADQWLSRLVDDAPGRSLPGRDRGADLS